MALLFLGEREVLVSVFVWISASLHPASVGFGLGLTECGANVLLLEAAQIFRTHLQLAGPLHSSMGGN